MVFIGIDISKASFDAAILKNNTYSNHKFTNNVSGFLSFVKWANATKQEPIFCLEATGIYGIALAKYLHNNKLKVIVTNPIKTHAFAKMEMIRNKTDKADAQCISRYTKHLFDKGAIEKNLFTPKDKEFERVQFLVTRLDQLEKNKSQENNRFSVSLDKTTKQSIKAMLKFIDKQIVKIHKEIIAIVNQSKALKSQVKLLTSISGFGDKTAWAILAYLGDIAFFSSSKQVSSYAGLNPRIEQSGSSINKSSLSKMGNKRLRKSLYMPALVAIRFNPLMMEFYQRLLANGKPKKVAIIAVMRKLLVIAYGVLKSAKPFDVNYAK